MRSNVTKGASAQAEWNAAVAAYKTKYPKEHEEFAQLTSGQLPKGWEKALPSYTTEDKPLATRQYSQIMLNALAPVLPGLMGGSADLAPSNLTLMKMFGDFQKGTYNERNVRFGVREHGMGAIVNGMGLHGSGIIPYCATFFIFTDYMRSAMRMSALSEIGVLYVMTHDSIGLGEDGPTHQPIEHLASFRAMPNMLMIRPAAGNETAGAYKVAVENRKRPTTIALSRQGMPNLPGLSAEGVAKGAYIIKDSGSTPDVIFMGTGSELELAYAAAEALEKEGKKVRVVSFPCWELFEEQSAAYKESVFPKDVKRRVAVEAGCSQGWVSGWAGALSFWGGGWGGWVGGTCICSWCWCSALFRFSLSRRRHSPLNLPTNPAPSNPQHKWIGLDGAFVGIDTFGASAPAPVLYEKFGITLDNLIKTAKSLF